MTIHQPDNDAHLREALLQQLNEQLPPRNGGITPLGPLIFTYGCFEKERLVQIHMSKTILGIVLQGTKEVWLGDTGDELRPGSVFVLPSNVTIDVVNIPDERVGRYETLLVEFDSLPQGVAPLSEQERSISLPTGGNRFEVPLSRDLIISVSHAATALSNPELHESICSLRLARVLTHLRRVPQAKPIFIQSLADQVAWHIRSAPSRDWTVADMASLFNMGASTLRRRLASEGMAFRKLLRTERMAIARNAIEAGSQSALAAEAVGYTSRSHFARRYREAFGSVPSDERNQTDTIQIRNRR